MLNVVFCVNLNLNLSYKKDGVCHILKKRFVEIIIDIREVNAIDIFMRESIYWSKREPEITSYDNNYKILGMEYKKLSKIIDSKYKVYDYAFLLSNAMVHATIRLKSEKFMETDFEEIIYTIKPSDSEIEGALFVN